MTRCSLICFLIFLSITISKAQTVNTIKGTVIDYESKLPIPNATVEIYNSKKIIYKTLTDSAGIFIISASIFNDYTRIKISSLTYHSLDVFKQNTTSKKTNLENNNLLKVFELSPRAIELKEVIIKKNKRYRDTTIIDLSKDIFERSIMIDDLFSQKGLYKDSSGRLFYNGKLVSDVVVNGGDFFGKNNLKIYDKIPALVVENIEIVETNIDSTTNTTLLRPAIKLNLKLKEKYQKGKFGNVFLGGGTTGRYVFNTDAYTYKKRQQISFSTGTNNIGINESVEEPRINFSSTGNNATKNYAKLTYRNIFKKKLEMNFSGKANTEKRIYLSELERKESNTSQFSKTRNSSISDFFKIDGLELNINYRIDSLNSLKLNSEFNYGYEKSLDTLNYYIKTDVSTTVSDLNKIRALHDDLLLNSILYEKKSSGKKGRLFQVDIKSEQITNRTNETSNILNASENYTINGSRNVKEYKLTINSSFTEPIGDQAYIKFLTQYKKEMLNYLSSLTGVSGIGLQDSNKLRNTFVQSGLMFQKTFNKTSFYGTIKGIVNTKSLNEGAQNPSTSFNTDFDIKIDRRINEKKSFLWNYSIKTNYPNSRQLTSINNTFDLISQTRGNIGLRPEIKHNLAFSYDFRKSDSLSLLIMTDFSRYHSKFGINLNNAPGKPQNAFVDNIGKSTSAQINLSISKTFYKIGNFNYRLNLGYNETPTLINTKKTIINGVTIDQSLSTSRTISKYFSISSVLSLSYNKYFYDSGPQTFTNLIYTDKFAFNLWGFEINNYPIINVSKSEINNNLTWAINAEIRKKILKRYGIIWVKAYDIFNSFQFQNNVFGASYTQSTKYSNLQRYFLLGFSLKMNNIK